MKTLTHSKAIVHFVGETTAGYKRLLTHTALAPGLLISVVPRQRVRLFAQTRFRTAKNDAIDAAPR